MTTMNQQLPVAKSVSGGGVKKDELTEKVAQGYGLGDKARSAMSDPAFTTTDTPVVADLAFLSLEDLGFLENPQTEDFMTARFCSDWSAKRLDGQVIELCQPEDGPDLRLQYDEQPKDEIIWMAMEPIDGRIFTNDRYSDGRYWLCANSARPGQRWPLKYRFAFRLRKLAES